MMYLIISVLFFLVVLTTTEKCKTPDNKEGECISLYLCTTLLHKLKTGGNATTEFVRKSACGHNGTDPFVCCGSLQPVHKNNTNKPKLLPDRRYCGYQHIDDYIHNDDSIAINEFPWFALLLYQNYGDDGIVSKCAGSLISNRYVLTSRRCLTDDRESELIGVRLGEYNTNNRTDCTTDDAGIDDCSDSVEDIGIETKIPYPENSRPWYEDNIALLRLNRKVDYTDYIRPICLPLPGTKYAKSGDLLFSTGFGFSNYYNGTQVHVKKKVYKKFLTNEECSLRNAAVKSIITDKQFCTVDIANNTDISCVSDAGAPIIFSRRNQWHQEGIESLSVLCGIGFPRVHTKVASYLDWIINNIKP